MMSPAPYAHWRDLDNDSQTPRYDAICSAITATDSVLDVGCGSGVLFGRLQAHGFHGRYLGLESDPSAVAAGHERFGPDAIVNVGEKEYAAKREWDVVVLSEVLYYVPDPIGTLRRYIGFVPDGGRVVVTIYLRPGRPRLKTLIRSLVNRRFPRSSIHCARMVDAVLSSQPGVATRDVLIPGTRQFWRVWVWDISFPVGTD